MWKKFELDPLLILMACLFSWYWVKQGFMGYRPKAKWQRGLIWFVVLGAAFAGMVFEGRSFWWFD